MKTISAAEANRNFSALLREVAGGARVTVTSRGRPVARILPIADGSSARRAAKRALMKRLARQRPIGDRDWTRDSLYD
jgi:prevent-host-death family protein